MMAIIEEPALHRHSPEQLDALAERREELKLELNEINCTISGQVEAFGFTPARAKKSRRLVGEKWQATLSYGDTTEIRDTQVELIKKACSASLFADLFREVRQYKLISGASMLLAGTLPPDAPRHLRQMFSAAVVIKPKAPALCVELLKVSQ